jgi:hypothetical protein
MALLLGVTSGGNASPFTLTDPVVDGNLYVNTTTSTNGATHTAITGPGSQTQSTSIAGVGTATITATAGFVSAPSIRLDAMATSTGTNDFAFGSENLTYYFCICGGPAGLVGLNIFASGAEETSSSFATANGSMTVDANFWGFQSGSPTLNVPSSTTYYFQANQAIRVEMSINVEAGANLNNAITTASAYIDPMFTFALLSDANQYTLDFSQGIGNSLASTPLPAALPLFATGLGLMGLFGRRRKRRDAALLAAA